jgi:hypothetical protein
MSIAPMNGTDFKALEGARIGAVHGAVGALPAAALVFADTPLVVAPGAPLFAAAIILVLGAYMHWNHTDTGYWLIGEICAGEDKEATNKKVREDLERSGTRHVAMNYIYALASVGCTAAGFAGVYSSFRSGMSVDQGFIAAGLVFAVTTGELVLSRIRQGMLLNRIVT